LTKEGVVVVLFVCCSLAVFLGLHCCAPNAWACFFLRFQGLSWLAWQWFSFLLVFLLAQFNLWLVFMYCNLILAMSILLFL
jgi:hypothetical protein